MAKGKSKIIKKKTALVTGAGGFIGHHLVKFLKEKNYYVRGVDIKLPEYEKTAADEFLKLDLREYKNNLKASQGMDEVYALAADMGGMGYISKYHARILRHNILINTHSVEAAKVNNVKRYFFPSSACVYPEFKQLKTKVKPLREEDAYPAQPQDAYGWEKLLTEILMHHYYEDYRLETRVARFHNIFGPLGTWDGERAKAPSTMCRKVAIAKLTGNHEVEVWGDGKQTRSFCYIDDCLEGIYRIMHSNYREPLNIGDDTLISINGLVDMTAKIAGIKVTKKYIDGPQGVRGRNSDNSRTYKVLKWKPKISLEKGMRKTYQWVEDQVRKSYEK